MRVIREKFLEMAVDDYRLKTVRAALVIAECSKSAISNVVNFVVIEGESEWSQPSGLLCARDPRLTDLGKKIDCSLWTLKPTAGRGHCAPCTYVSRVLLFFLFLFFLVHVLLPPPFLNGQ